MYAVYGLGYCDNCIYQYDYELTTHLRGELPFSKHGEEICEKGTEVGCELVI